MSWVDLPGMAHYKQELAFYALDRRVTLTLPSPYLRNMPSQLTIETGQDGTPFAARTVEIVSYEEAFKRELVEFAAAIEAAPRAAHRHHRGAARRRALRTRSPGRTSPAGR